MLVVAIIVAVVFGAWRPSWRGLFIFLVFVASAQAAALAYEAGVFENGFDFASPQASDIYRSIAKPVIVNTLIVATIAALVVMIGKHFREKDARELELLATLTQQKPRGDA